MRIRSFIATLLLLISGLGLTPNGMAQCPGNLLVNGSMNSTPGAIVTAPGWITTAFTPDINTAGSPVNTSPGYIWGGTPLPSNDGGTWQSLYWLEGIGQPLSLVRGRRYLLQFEFALQPIGMGPGGAFGAPFSVRIYLNNTLITVTPKDSTPFTWEHFCYEFQAPADSVFLELAGDGTYSYLGIDGVCLVPSGPADGFSLGRDTTLCLGDTLILSPGLPGDYLWQDGSTNPVYQVTQPGLYYVTLTRNCLSYTDTIRIGQVDSAANLLGPDTLLCPGNSLPLSPAGAFSGYTWQDGTTDPVFVADQPGTYWVACTNACGILRDTIQVGTRPPSPDLQIRENLKCPGDTLRVTTTEPWPAYLWSDGSTGTAFPVTTPGNYFVVATDACGSRRLDFTIRERVPQAPPELGRDSLLCEDRAITLDAGPGWTSYLWQDQSRGRTLLASPPGSYAVQVTDECFTYADSITLTAKACECPVFFPNAFSPNGDGINEFFSPVYNCPADFFQVSVYDRWGNLVFDTRDLNASWDGSIGGREAPEGVYIFRASWAFPDGEKGALSGSITLFR